MEELPALVIGEQHSNAGAERIFDNSYLASLPIVGGYSDDPFVNCDFCSFKLQRLLGRGSYGEVWKAQYKDEVVALKLISSTNEVLRGIFYREVDAMRNFDHPNVVAIMGACVTPVCAIVMEYMPCGSLDQLLHHSKNIGYTADHVFHWAFQCTDAMDYIHGRGCIHADLKPANLLLDKECHLLKVADFGTMTYMSTNGEFRQGSAHWMAPEVFAGAAPSFKSDCYSFGITLWEMITRRRPYSECETVEEILWSVYGGLRPPPIDDIPSKAMKMIECCWSASLDERPVMKQIKQVLNVLCMMYPNHNEPLSRNETVIEEQKLFNDGNDRNANGDSQCSKKIEQAVEGDSQCSMEIEQAASGDPQFSMEIEQAYIGDPQCSIEMEQAVESDSVYTRPTVQAVGGDPKYSREGHLQCSNGDLEQAVGDDSQCSKEGIEQEADDPQCSNEMKRDKRILSKEEGEILKKKHSLIQQYQIIARCMDLIRKKDFLQRLLRKKESRRLTLNSCAWKVN